MTMTYMALSMLLRMAIRWPEVYSANLWPFSVSYACHDYNNMPRQATNLSVEEMYSGVKVGFSSHVGCNGTLGSTCIYSGRSATGCFILIIINCEAA